MTLKKKICIVSVITLTTSMSLLVNTAQLHGRQTVENKITDSQANALIKPKRGVDLVYPHLDSANSRWFYFDSASRPFGLVNLSPDTEVAGAWGSGYRYNTNEIKGFSHVHAWQLSALSVLPVADNRAVEQLKDDYYSAFSHKTEVVKPGYHKLILERYGIKAELTASKRVGMHRYHYNNVKGDNAKSESAKIMLPLFGPMGPTDFPRGEIKKIGDRAFSGFVINGATRRRPKETPVYFYIELDHDVKGFTTWLDDDISASSQGVSGEKAGALIDLGQVTAPVLMKVGISYTSTEGAKNNIDAEITHWDFDRVVAEADEEWNNELSRIKVEGGSKNDRVRFYSDLWHSLQGRRIISDADGSYADMTTEKRLIKQLPKSRDGQPRFNHYNFDAFWGAQWTIQTLWPLVYPEVASGFVNSMVQYYKDGGTIPRGPSGGNYTYVMAGASATPFIVSTYMKGIRDFETQTAFNGMLKGHSTGGIMGRAGYEHFTTLGGDLDRYIKQGFAAYPLDKSIEAYHKAGGSYTLEYAYQDYALAQYALAQGKEKRYLAKEFIKRSANWQNLWDDETGFIRPRNIDGKFMTPYDPIISHDGFQEANGFQATWYVPHDIEGLANKMGGNERAIKRLNSQFESAQKVGFTNGNKLELSKQAMKLSKNIQINYGNQPSMQTAYIFQKLGSPWLTQYWLDKVNRAIYTKVSPSDGFNGDEDQGLMGALSVLMKIGLFQMTGVEKDSTYLITSPVFDKVTIDLSEHYYHGGQFTIIANNRTVDGNNKTNIYIQSAKFNGKSLNKLALTHSQIVAGGTLELEMAAQPNKSLK
jgi:predicted alpha-1,2-mannosidase